MKRAQIIEQPQPRSLTTHGMMRRLARRQFEGWTYRPVGVDIVRLMRQGPIVRSQRELLTAL